MGRDSSPSLPRHAPRCRGPARSLHCHPPLELPPGSQVDLSIPEHCASTHRPVAASPVPRSRFSLCHLHLPRAAVEEGGDGWCSWRPWHSASLQCQVCVLVCTSPQTAVGHVPPSATQPCQPRCHHCAMDRADPGRLFGHLASPLQHGLSPLPSLPGHRASAHKSVPAPPTLPSLSSPFPAPASPKDTGWWVARSDQGQVEP